MKAAALVKNTSNFNLRFCVNFACFPVSVSYQLYYSIALLLLMSLSLLFTFSFPRLGLTDGEEWLAPDGSRGKTIVPGGKALSGQAAEKVPPPVAGPDIGADSVEDTKIENIPVMPKPPIKVRLPHFFVFWFGLLRLPVRISGDD